MKKVIFSLIFIFCLICVTASYAQDSNVPITITSNCSDVNLTEVNGVAVNAPMTHLGGQTFYYNFTNTSEVGEYTYSWSPSCQSCNEVNCGNSFIITPFGEDDNFVSGFVQVFLLFFFLVLIILFYYVRKDINFEKWHNAIQNKYTTKNTPKVMMASVGYLIMKENFLMNYLLVFPIVTILLNLIVLFNVGALSTLTDLIIITYLIGLLFVSLVFFGKTQEYIVGMADLIKSKEWGIGNEK